MRCLTACLALGMAITFGATLREAAAGEFNFKKPGNTIYYSIENDGPTANSIHDKTWISLRSTKWGTNQFKSTSRLVLKTYSVQAPTALLQGKPLILDKTVAPGLFILQAPDARTALEQAEQLSACPAVAACYPVMSRPKAFFSTGGYSAAPDDPFFPHQWHLENRSTTGAPVSAGADINARQAWATTLGQGVIIAFGDSGVQYTNAPDLEANNLSGLNLDFSTVAAGKYSTGSTNALPTDGGDAHATEVAGLAVAAQNNGVGVSGVAPAASYASWKVFTSGNFALTTEQEMMMYEYRSNVVAVQNYSWGDNPVLEEPLDDLENLGLQNAVIYGRAGKGAVIVRAAGNDRLGGRDAQSDGNDANDDPYANDVREIAVAAVGADGRVASYSSPGACVLVAGPGGDFPSWNRGWPWEQTGIALYTTAYSLFAFPGDPNNPNYYATSDATGGFVGTSASTPIVAGIAALALSVNTNLGYRDVQQLFAVSSRHYDLADPAVQTNGAGLRVSANVGYGVPDAGLAVRLAQGWSNRPAAVSVTKSITATAAIPQDGLRLVIPGAPAALQSIHGTPALGAQADQPTLTVPLTGLGVVNGPVPQNLTGQAAVILRGVQQSNFYQIIEWAAQAGAVFAVICDSTVEPRFQMTSTDLTPIPAMLITQSDGQALTSYLQTNNAIIKGQMATLATNLAFTVTNTLVCEHVSVTVTTTCTNRSGMRIVLTSPMGTKSVLQHLNGDTSAGPNGWTYTSALHFLESSAGTWLVSFSYEQPGGSGNVTGVSLKIDGVPIVDTDHDGLDDRWERTWFGGLSQGPADAPAGDGWPNSVKQILGVNPNVSLFPFTVDLSFWSPEWTRLAWPGVAGSQYDVLSLGSSGPTGIPGQFSTTEAFIPTGTMGFFRIRQP